MLKSIRFALVLMTASFGLALGCNNESAPEPPKPLPKIHPNGTPPTPALPASVTTPRPDPSHNSAGKQVREILAEREMFERNRRLAELLAELGPEAIEDVRQILGDEVFNVGGAESVLLVRYWALHDPAAATRWVLFEAPRGLRVALTVPTMELWAMASPIDAQLQLQAMMLLPNSETVAMEMGLISGWFQSQTPGLEDYVRGLGVGRSRQRALRFLARLSIEHYGPEAAIRWAVSLPEDNKKFKLDAYRQLGMELGKSHTAQAVDFCKAECDSDFGDGLRKMIAQQWATHDGPAAMAWLKPAPPGQQKKWALKAAYDGWWSGDRQALHAWLDAMGPEKIEPWLQPIVESMAVHTGKADPQRGFAWAGAILDDVDRERTFVTVALNWRKKNPESADSWLLDSPLSEEARERVRTYGVRKPPRPKKQAAAPAPEAKPSTIP